jgi:hypothetical protein
VRPVRKVVSEEAHAVRPAGIGEKEVDVAVRVVVGPRRALSEAGIEERLFAASTNVPPPSFRSRRL